MITRWNWVAAALVMLLPWGALASQAARANNSYPSYYSHGSATAGTVFASHCGTSTCDGCCTAPHTACDPGCCEPCTTGCCGAGCCDPCCADSCCSGGCAPCACDRCGDPYCGGCGGRLFGLIAPSDYGFNDYISPMTNPVYFEDPRTLTEARIIYLHHRVPIAATGGDINLWAMQLRAALTDRLSFIATKDGFITSTNPLINDGWADVSAGLKYNFFANYATGTLLSAGLVYELPVGSAQALQGTGDGLFNVFMTGGITIGQFHWISATGFLLPTNRVEESSLWFWSNHWDRRLGNTNLYVLAELNWYHYMGAGNSFPLPIEGGDLFNLGSIGVAGNDIVTGAFGLKAKPFDNVELGIAWEHPLTRREDVLDNRLTVDAILRY